MIHTPGPWYVEGTRVYREISETNRFGRLITFRRSFSVSPQWSNVDQRRIDARLIAAAPELLEALHDMHSIWDFADPITSNVPITFEDASAINAAMTKALKAMRKAAPGVYLDESAYAKATGAE
jgi:hypothetical protein